jgi:hypothetical protein
MSSKNSTAMGIAVVAGILLLIAGVNGILTWETIKVFVTTHIMDNTIVQFVFAILIFIASLGGLAVIVGGILIGKKKLHTGKFLITLGAGLGLIGLIVSIIISIIEGSFTIGAFLSIGMVGLLLSIVARAIAK